MRTVLTVEFIVCAVLENAFLVLYMWRSPWRDSPTGRMLVAYSAAVSGLMDLAFISLWWQPTPWLFVIGYGLFGLALLQRDVLLLRAQTKDRK